MSHTLTLSTLSTAYSQSQTELSQSHKYSKHINIIVKYATGPCCVKTSKFCKNVGVNSSNSITHLISFSLSGMLFKYKIKSLQKKKKKNHTSAKTCCKTMVSASNLQLLTARSSLSCWSFLPPSGTLSGTTSGGPLLWLGWDACR